MPALTLAGRPVVSDDVSAVPILSNLATVIAHGIVAALTFVATHRIQVAVAFIAALAVLATVPIVVAVVIACIDDNNPRSHPRPSSRHHETTRLLHQPPNRPSYAQNSYTRSQSQTAGQTPATPHYYRSSHSSGPVLPHAGTSRPTPQKSVRTQVSYQPPSTYGRVSQHTVQTSATTSNERSLYRSGSCLTSPDAGQSRQTVLASARTQASYQPPSTYGSVSQYTVRASATTDNEQNLHRSGPCLTSPSAGQSRQTVPASARTQVSYQPPSTYGRVSQPTVQTSATTDNERSLYRSGSCLTSPDAGQSRQILPASVRTQTPYQSTSTSSCSQTTVRNPATTDRSLYDPSPVPPPAGESRQATSTSAHAQASYQRSPDPDPADIFTSYQSSLTHPRTLSSPSACPQDSTTVGRSTPTQVAQPSAVLAVLSDLVSDELENVEDVNTAMDIRERARRQHREMCDARARARSAHEGGDYVAERRHNQVAKARRSAMDQLNTRAAEMIFKQKNKGRKQGTVDFHGLYVHEAVRYAKQELESASRRDDEVVHFIVGKGLHAEDGQAKIRPALEELCNKRGLTHSLDPRNAGVLVVQVS